MPRKHIDKLALYLRAGSGKASIAQIQKDFDWSEEKIRELIDQNHGTIRLSRHGVTLIGNEVGKRGRVPLYRDVSGVLERTWAKRRKFQAAVALDTSQGGGASTGTWSRPDCVLVSYPARRSNINQPPHLSTFEIEKLGGFSIQSVYEAHSHGWGADYSWVVFVRGKNVDRARPSEDWERVVWAAKTCGVGLLSCTNPANISTWYEHLPASYRNDGRREDFVRYAIPRDLHGITNLRLEELRKIRSVKNVTRL